MNTPSFPQTPFALLNLGASLSSARRVRCGFTLIEIIVVLAIVMILAAILLPVFNGARETARITTCNANLKQIGLAIDQYVQDSGGFYPIDKTGTLIAGNCGWASRIYPYLKSAELLQCPTFERGEYLPNCPPSEPITIKDEPTQYENWDGSYDISANMDFRNGAGMVSSVRVKKPADRILSFDGVGQSSTFEQKPPTAAEILIQQGYNRHNSGLNALFFDGHVKWISFDHIYDDNYWRPTP